MGEGYAERLIAATDNSIYQRLPPLVIYPRHGEDLALAILAAHKGKCPLTPRGGGGGTNAPSLTKGVIVDVTRYVDRIFNFD